MAAHDTTDSHQLSGAPAASGAQLPPTRLKHAEYVRSHYRIEPIAGASLNDVCAPDYLGHVAAQLRPGDLLEIMPECMSWYAEAIVVDATKLSARIQPTLGPVSIDAGEQVLASDIFAARWISPTARFGVVRKADDQLMAKQFPTKADAEQWIAQRVGMKVVSAGDKPKAKSPKRKETAA